jgi:hypothetical protein
MTPQSRVVHDVVVKQGRGVQNFDCSGHGGRRRGHRASEAGRQQRQRWAEPLSTGIEEITRDVGHQPIVTRDDLADAGFHALEIATNVTADLEP